MKTVRRFLGGMKVGMSLAFGKKELVVEGGLEMLSRLTSGNVTPTALLEKYKKSLYVFACVWKIAVKVSSIDLELYRIMNSKGDTKEIDAHPVIDLLYKCNPFQTRSEFWQLTMINLLCSGDAFWYKVRNNSGKVVEIWNLRPDLMTIVTSPTRFILQYELRKNDGTKEIFQPEDIVHFKKPDPLSTHTGMSPLKAAITRVESEGFMNEYQKDLFLNSARPDAVIKNPTLALSADQKEDIKEAWERKYRGVGKGSKVAILDGGLEYQVISFTQKEMDFIESMKFTRDDILVAFGVPKSVVGITEDVNRANSETGLAIFLGETIKPEMEGLVEKINEEMVIPDFGEDLYLDFEDPTPKNREQEKNELTGYTAAGIMLINEARDALGLPPVKGGWTLYKPLNEVAVGGLSQAEKVAMIGGENEKEAYLGNVPQKKKKRFDFRGRSILKQRLEAKEELMAQVITLASKIRKGQIKPAKKHRSLIKEEIRTQYHEFVNKAIDGKSAKLKDEVDGFFKEQGERVLKAFDGANKGKKKVKGKEIFDTKQETRLTIEFIEPRIAEMLKAAGVDGMELVAPAETFDGSTAKVREFIKKRSKEFAESVGSTTLEKLDKTLAEGIAEAEGIVDLRNRVEEVYKDFPLYRSEMIARTEATAANNQGLVESFRQSGVATGKEWINAGDGRVREEHQNGIGVGGEIVPLDKEFSNGLTAPNEPNCRCVVGPAFIEE